jgi:ribA/ribD-fused uncharacterized protein
MINKFEGRYRFLSNFYPCEIEHKGIVYKSVEAFYVAMKVTEMQLLDGVYYTAADFREMISKIINPGDVKRIGRKVKVRSDWDSKKLEFMNWAVREKFKDESLAELLLSTGDGDIIEGNYWHDNFFGSCTCAKCGFSGRNELGKILMAVRSEIKLSNQKPSIEDLIKKDSLK